ncbi:VWA domain-containing protein, partial [Acidobacteria bacterium AH-259-A15]|nr:VWA domain-containing protein [Acidobacteria bacterium AH-259-A15]
KTLRALFCCWTLLICSSFQDPQIRVEVEAVNVLATVTDNKGRFIIDLTENDFEVREDGVLQEITNFSQPSDLPLQIALLIDTSASVRLKLDFEKRAATNFLYSVMRPEDQALLVEFDTGISLLHDFTNRTSAIARAIKGLRAGGGTALLDALYVVSRDKMGGSAARKTVVIVSDGRDLNSRRTMKEAVEMAHRAGVIIYGIGTTRFGADQDRKGERMLEELTENTGGRVFFPYSAERLSDAFELINEELRTQYSITFVPTNKAKDSKFRKIQLKVLNRKKLNVRHRKGYFAPSE